MSTPRSSKQHCLNVFVGNDGFDFNGDFVLVRYGSHGFRDTFLGFAHSTLREEIDAKNSTNSINPPALQEKSAELLDLGSLRCIRFEAFDYWRPGKDKASRHKFALQYGWVAWNHGHRKTWWTFATEALRLRPLALDSWRLLIFGGLRKPRREPASEN